MPASALPKAVESDKPVTESIERSIQAFEGWLDRVGPDSYDPYDLWGTGYGLYARRLYYRKNPLGYLLIAPILLAEILCPSIRGLFVSKCRYATSDGQLVLAFLNLYEQWGDKRHLDKAVQYAADLLKTSVPGYSGYCWGYPFDWQNAGALWRKDTPFITATPYVYEANMRLFEMTREIRYADIARSIAKFVHDDLRDTPTSPTAAAGSYSPVANDQVVNATAYRAMVLFHAAHHLGIPEYSFKAERNLNFILENQRPDGSWYYAIHEAGQSFIDHFHTCFVLKNLYKINLLLRRPALAEAIQRGWNYYRDALFHPDGLPRFFSIEPRFQLVRLEMYNMAEAITLGSLLRDQIPNALETAQLLAERLVQDYQVREGHFITRVYRGGMRHAYPFLRWPQAQLFYALTNLLATLRRPA